VTNNTNNGVARVFAAWGGIKTCRPLFFNTRLIWQDLRNYAKCRLFCLADFTKQKVFQRLFSQVPKTDEQSKSACV